MGRKDGAVSASEPVAEQQTLNTTTQLESSKKKNTKNKHNLQNEESTPNRKHEELNLENDTEKKSKKKKKHSKSKHNREEGNGAETVSGSDEPIMVTGKNRKRKHEELNLENDTEKKSKKKKKHSKSKHNGEEGNGAETVSGSDKPIMVTGKNRKRKHEELNLEDGTEKKSKKKKHSKSKHNGEEGNGAETVSGSDKPIMVTGKNRKRKHKELNLEDDTEKKSKKKKKHSKSKHNGEEGNGGNGTETVSASDELIIVTGKNADDNKYAAVKSFAGLGLPVKLLECCNCFEKPLSIQSRVWPFLLDGRDLIGIAATGSGKTLAFGLPAIMHVFNTRKRKGFSEGRNPLCLMLSPTRELAQQISDVLCDAGKSCGVESVCWYGGTSRERQISALRSGIDIVIGTPGGIKDLVEMGICCLKEVTFVVLDEADRMLDMGFGQKVSSILGQTHSVNQKVMFSATWPLEVRMLAQKFMDSNHVKVVVGSEDLSAHHDVTQTVEVLDENLRDERLLDLLEEYLNNQKKRVLVFVLYKHETRRVEEVLGRGDWTFVSISGNMSQHERTQALSSFKNGTYPLMIATDVAARGLDIPGVEVVINFSFPLILVDYLHRIGKTGRGGKKGVAHTFFTRRDKGLSGELVNVLKEAKQDVPDKLLAFQEMPDAAASKSKKTTFYYSDDED